MSEVRAGFFIILIILIWGSMIVVSLPFLFVVLVYDLLVKPRYSWLQRALLVQDLATNVMLGGDHRTYISSMLGHLQTNGSTGGTYAALFVNYFWNIAFKQKNHCIKAMRSTDIYDFSARRGILGATIYLVNLYLIYSGFNAI